MSLITAAKLSALVACLGTAFIVAPSNDERSGWRALLWISTIAAWLVSGALVYKIYG